MAEKRSLMYSFLWATQQNPLIYLSGLVRHITLVLGLTQKARPVRIYPPKSGKVKFSPFTGLKGYGDWGTPSAQVAAIAPPGDTLQSAGPSQSSTQPCSGFGASTLGAFIKANSFTHSLFHGSPSEDAKAWPIYFKRYALFRKFSDDDLLSVFPLFLRTAATYWFDQLSDEIRRDFEQLEASFLARFTSSDFMQWVQVSDMFSRVHKQTATVDEYVVQIPKTAKAVEIKDDNFIRYAILKGLNHKYDFMCCSS